jgi:hypothetical protein
MRESAFITVVFVPPGFVITDDGKDAAPAGDGLPDGSAPEGTRCGCDGFAIDFVICRAFHKSSQL